MFKRFPLIIIVSSLSYFNFMQFAQRVGQYHLIGTEIFIIKSDYLWVTSGATTVGT